MNFLTKLIVLLVLLNYINCAGRYDKCQFNNDPESRGYCEVLSDCKNPSDYFCDNSFVCCEVNRFSFGFGFQYVKSNDEFPHMALIGYEVEEGENPWSCAGSLITNIFVLSAAHCNAEQIPNLALLGVTDYVKDYDKANIRSIIQVIEHPDYDFNEKTNDISLYRLNASVLSITICLPKFDDRTPFELVAIGWGATSLFSGMSQRLLKMELNVWNTTKCSVNYNETIQICAGSDKPVDTCSGDSGGPLQTKPFLSLNPDFKFTSNAKEGCISTIYGIVSYGKACLERSETSSIYTKVSNYLKWIEDIVWYGTMDCE